MGARPSPPRWQRTRAPLTRGLRDGARRERIKQLNAARSAEPPSKPRGLYKRLSLRAAQPGQRASVAQYKKLLASVRPRGEAGKMRRRMAAEELDEVARLDAKLKAMKAELRAAVLVTGSHLMDIHGIGPAGAARILADVGDVARFPNRDHFASWNGTAPIDASSGQHIRHRLSRAGNRRINHVLYMAGIVQLRNDTKGRRYYRRRLADGKTAMEAMRCLRRQLSDVVYRQLTADAAAKNAGPGGHPGTTLKSSAADLTPDIGSSDKPLPGPAHPTLPPASATGKTTGPGTAATP